MEKELTETEQKIFDKIVEEYKRRGTKRSTFWTDEQIKRVIQLANTNGDGKKRIVDHNGITHLVPIEDIFLFGVKEQELDKYPTG